MKSLNIVTLRGQIGSVRKMVIGQEEPKCVIRFTLATECITKTNKGIPVCETEWHNVVAIKSSLCPYLNDIETGATAEIEGRLKYVRYTSTDGTERVLAEIKAEKIKIIPNE